MDELLALARPSVGVVTCVGIDHRSAFRTLDAVAEEKGKLVARLPADGLAVLNADDPLVIAMAARTAARVVTFGTSVGAEVRAVDARGTWPDRLTFELEWKGETHTVATRLCGLHWTTAVVAALAVGFELGVPVADAIAAVSEVEPVDGRMRPETVDGVTFVFDDAKNPQWSLPIALQFMADAEAERKIVVLGPLSDYSDKAEPANRRAAAAALGVAEIVIGTGHHAKYMARARSDDDRVPVLAETVDEVDAVLAPMLRPGDLVYVRGGRKIGLGSLARRHAARVTAS
jgi:UDP-N-acetylmuramoyl-tripeptide--D-alanyl-D-alanine ligase